MPKFNKIAVTSLILGLLVIKISVAGTADLNKGVLGMDWRTAARVNADLEKVHSKGSVDYYADTTRTAVIGEVNLTRVIHGFYLGKFYAVFLEIQSDADFVKIRAALKNRFGPWKQTRAIEQQETVYQWKSGDVKIKLKDNQKTARKKLVFYYLPLSAALNEERLEQTQAKAFEVLPIKRDKKPKALPLFTF